MMPVTDREAIIDLIYRYCRAVDRIDHQLGYSIWHEDGTADYGAAVYQGSGRGFIDYVCAAHLQTLGHSHQVTNIVLEIDGERAVSEAYNIAALRVMRDGQPHEITVRGRYLDRWSKRAGHWGIDHRQTVRDFADIRPVTPMDCGDGSRRGRDDPSYALLERHS